MAKKKKPKKGKPYYYRYVSSLTGYPVSEAYAKRHPATTIRQRCRNPWSA